MPLSQKGRRVASSKTALARQVDTVKVSRRSTKTKITYTCGACDREVPKSSLKGGICVTCRVDED